DPGGRVVEPDLAERDLNPRALLDRRRRRQVVALPLLEHEEVIQVRVVLADEIEAPARLLLELDQPGCSRADQERRDLGRDLDAVRLAPRARRERAQPALVVDRGRRLREDDAVAAARRA